jgi:hypothetical protein
LFEEEAKDKTMLERLKDCVWVVVVLNNVLLMVLKRV